MARGPSSDPYTKIRRSTKEDLGRNTKVADSLKVLPVAYRSVAARDKPGAVQALPQYGSHVSQHIQNIFLSDPMVTDKNASKIIDMAAFIMGGKDVLRERPIVTFNVYSPASQLGHGGRYHCRQVRNMESPAMLYPWRFGRATGPVTAQYDVLVTHNAEVLSAVVLSQLTKKGAPVLYGSSTSMMDMRHLTTPAVGAPELAMISNAVAQLSQYYLLPSFVAGG